MIPFKKIGLLAIVFLFLIQDQANTQDLEIFTSPVTEEEGASFCVDIQANGFVDILTLQMSMHWDTSIIRFDSLDNYNLPFGDENDFGYPSVIGLGTLTMSLANNDLVDVNLADGDALFQLCFTAVGTGITGISIDDYPTFIEIYDVNINEVNLIVGESVITIGAPIPLVWPGDTNEDEVVNHFDLLNIGLGYGLTGPAREDASLAWEAQASTDWESATPISGINFNQADTDGNGLIDANDTLAILQNWEEERNFQEDEEERFGIDKGEAWLNDVPPIYVLPDTIIAGEMGNFDIMLGEDASPASNVFGLAFSITYDPELIVESSVSINFSDSWMGEPGNDILGLHHDNYSEGRVDVAITRINGLNQSGQGKIGTMQLLTNGQLPPGQDYDLFFDIQNVRIINAAEEEVEATALSTTSIIKNEMTSTNTLLWNESIHVFPNPTTDQMYIVSDKYLIEEIRLYSLDGRLLQLEKAITDKVDLSNYPKGTYLLQFITPQGIYHHKVQKTF